MTQVFCIDLHLSEGEESIASYLIPYVGGAVLVDCGPGSTQESLVAGLAAHGLTPQQVTHVLLTHIHLDHAGAAGWLARQGTHIYVHPKGAPHLLNPERLLASARRIYGERMDELWGEFLPVPEEKLTEVQDGAEIVCGGLRFTALYTPGHAEHHIAYVFENTCFSGDVGGVRWPGPFYMGLPFVPPETHLGKWRDSLERMQAAGCERIALSHFGFYENAAGHLQLARRILDEVEQWLAQTMPDVPDVETLSAQCRLWLQAHGKRFGLSAAKLAVYTSDRSVRTAASALFRYWNKVVLGQ